MNIARNSFTNIKTTKSNTPQQGKSLNRGFTIIEVALVLAIAGLIFLVVFLALPALQNSQKDTAKRQDVAKVVTAIENYYADGGGTIMPTACTGTTVGLAGVFWIGKCPALTNYINQNQLAEKETAYIYTYPDSTASLSASPGATSIDIHVGKQCPSSASSTSVSAPLPDATSPNDVAVAAKLSSGTNYCVEATD